MQRLSARDILLVWEHGLDRSWVDRALLLLHWALRERQIDDVYDATIGERAGRAVRHISVA